MASQEGPDREVQDVLKFVLDPTETPGERVARIAREAASEGAMGAHLRRERYAAFLEIWNLSEDLSTLIDHRLLTDVKTSCAVCASAILGYAGRELRRPWKADGTWGITSWLGMGFTHPAWVDVADAVKHGQHPSIGDVVYRGSKSGGNGHVQVLVETDGAEWVTVEGGGNLAAAEAAGMKMADIKRTNGTVMRMSAEPKNIWAPDSLGRVPAGWWVSNLSVPTYEELLERLREANQT